MSEISESAATFEYFEKKAEDCLEEARQDRVSEVVYFALAGIVAYAGFKNGVDVGDTVTGMVIGASGVGIYDSRKNRKSNLRKADNYFDKAEKAPNPGLEEFKKTIDEQIN
jgi:hypothetical protein